MLIGIRQISKSPVNYPPATAKCVYDNYLPDLGGHVLDPSAGYSGRLLGAYYSKRVLSYTGLEPAKLTLEGSQKILSLLKSFSPEIEKPMNLHQQGAEEWKPLDKKGFFDLIFTSPPYFNHEWYSEEESQVCNFCKNLKDYENWIKSCLDNWRFLLKPSGKIIIQVSDPMTQSNTRLPIIKQWETAIENKGVKYLDRLTYESPGNRGKRLTETVLILGF
jgi:16S rRNA G966 N2-methylase RsmD